MPARVGRTLRGLLPLRFGRQARAAPPRRTRRPRTSRRAAPARASGSGSMRPNRCRVQPPSARIPELRMLELGLGAPRPAVVGPPPRVVVAAGVDELDVRRVGHRGRVDAERRQVDDVRGPFVVVGPRVGRRAHRERARVDQHVEREVGRVAVGRARAVARVRMREAVDELHGREQRLVVLVLVVDDEPVDEPIGKERVVGVERDARPARRARACARRRCSRVLRTGRGCRASDARSGGGGTRRRCRRSAGRSDPPAPSSRSSQSSS